MKDILLIGGTHGDEKIGVDILSSLEKERNDFDWIIGNPKAYEIDAREFGGDLNRAGEGDFNSQHYADRRAAQIQQRSSLYRYTIDIHGSVKNVGLFVIVTHPTPENLQLAVMLGIERIVIWPSITPDMQSPLSEFFSCGVEIECGIKTDPERVTQLRKKLVAFLDDHKEREQWDWHAELDKRSLYTLVGDLKKTEVEENLVLEEFTQTTIKGDTFTPIFIGSYNYDDVICYKLQHIQPEDVLQGSS
jgi:succinylglutamate desuccinylase